MEFSDGELLVMEELWKGDVLDENGEIQALAKYNATVSGLHNYYQLATNVSLDFAKIAFHIKKQMNNRLDIW